MLLIFRNRTGDVVCSITLSDEPNTAERIALSRTVEAWRGGLLTDECDQHDTFRNAEEAIYLIEARMCDDSSIYPEVAERADAEARRQVERELYEAGVIEDPDVDGGLLG